MSRPRVRVLFTALLLLACAAATGRESPPPAGPLRPFVLPVKRELHLANGMAATFMPFGAVPKATLLLVIRTGNNAEGAKTGLGDLATELLKEGAGSRDAAGLAEFAAEMGGALETGPGPDQTTVSLDVLAERAGDAIALIADVVRRPHLPATELPRHKMNLSRQSAIARSQAQGIAGEAFAHLLWGDHPYGHELPTEAEIGSISIEDVRTFVTRQFSAGRAHLYIAGQFDEAAVEAALHAGFDDWATGEPPASRPATGSRVRTVKLIDRPGAQQSTIILGLPVPGPKAEHFTGLSVANALLGGSLLSRLDQDLREDKGWTYGASSRIAPLAGGVASWTLATDVNAPDTAPALGEIFKELERLRTEPAPVDELKSIQNYRGGVFIIGASSRGGILGQLAFLEQQGLPDEWLTNYAARIDAVTPAELRAAAADFLDPAAMTLVVVADLKKLRPTIEALPALKGASFQ